MHHPKHSPSGTESRRWTTATRYYTLRIQQNLFGTWELLKVWGGRRSRHGRHQVVPAETREEAVNLLESECRRRVQRGYRAA
ncbi:MAG: WGR domain-containing protein [Ideonella sp.]|nr:WGR domain-containing protein [Ideonella sp.]